MITVRPSSERGHFDHGWLDTYHTFSFAGYDDPRFRGFRALRVINEDVVSPGAGFGRHPHRDMEILTYVLTGALEHADSLGNGSVIRPGEIQRMTAGTGIAHSEANPSQDEPVHLLQIWIRPDRAGLEPSYEQKRIALATAGWTRIASRDGRDGSVTIHQDAAVWVGRPAPGGGGARPFTLDAGRHAWLQVARGNVTLNGHPLAAGDGAAIRDETALIVEAPSDGPAAEVLLFDLA